MYSFWFTDDLVKRRRLNKVRDGVGDKNPLAYWGMQANRGLSFRDVARRLTVPEFSMRSISDCVFPEDYKVLLGYLCEIGVHPAYLFPDDELLPLSLARAVLEVAHNDGFSIEAREIATAKLSALRGLYHEIKKEEPVLKHIHEVCSGSIYELSLNAYRSILLGPTSRGLKGQFAQFGAANGLYDFGEHMLDFYSQHLQMSVQELAAKQTNLEAEGRRLMDIMNRLRLALFHGRQLIDSKLSGKALQKAQGERLEKTKKAERLMADFAGRGEFLSLNRIEKWKRVAKQIRTPGTELNAFVHPQAFKQDVVLEDGRVLRGARIVDVFCRNYADVHENMAQLEVVKSKIKKTNTAIQDFREFCDEYEDVVDFMTVAHLMDVLFACETENDLARILAMDPYVLTHGLSVEDQPAASV